MEHTPENPYCSDQNCVCHTNATYHRAVTGASVQADVHEYERLGTQVNALRGVMWDLHGTLIQRRAS